ncbi:ABC transporter ATP-binding protein [Rathayibacter sp. AY1E9]|uniref:ABC transporter ATP-binding protein n=1 Tax=unclassified Rathayibacter TaxID=2609250 RepID=UPI000CE7DDA4|nr:MULTISPECIES: ABC transporter ATP-binding protein [unclassified Rathayibacter]PPF44042.1 ABC transporter ATP-binding protein [Rathayibacter sp. AY1A1]PPF67864.1 ABC transporter ATP-binding protein [Rathayibacter sp. AY1E6]PPG08148.1 ABC transporter ATP-binding protein [Rathayibacter sp. AY2B1]PPG17647.1 ABC transporter ATP-binding protein [Rathayibacter sp. AY1E8]PPG44246.1 ABC transporter ATP-binding protein [Rathayibacter sp. AY2B5]
MPKTPVSDITEEAIVPGVRKKDPIVVADNVSRRFGGLTAVDVEHLEIPRGSITALIGPNGAGKTTFFNLLTGFDKPNTGKWNFKGKNLANVPAYRVSRMGMVRTFQLTKALGGMTVLENMLLGAKGQKGENIFTSLIRPLWSKEEDSIEQRAIRLLEKFKLDTKRDDYASSLSGGQKKLLEMARALMSEPELVMLDEPMAGVNPALTQSLLGHIVNLKDEGMTVLFVEHDMHMVNTIADWVIVMAEGKVVAEGPPSTVMNDPAVIDAYLGAHHDTDLGTIEGQLEIAEEMDSDLVREDVERQAEQAGVPTPGHDAPAAGTASPSASAPTSVAPTTDAPAVEFEKDER